MFYRQQDIENLNDIRDNRIEIANENSNKIVEEPVQASQGFFRRVFVNPIVYIFGSLGSCFCSRRQEREGGSNVNNIESSIFEKLPCYTKHTEEVGKLIIYSNSS